MLAKRGPSVNIAVRFTQLLDFVELGEPPRVSAEAGDLHVLYAVVHHDSMAKGATHLGLSQPAISSSIANLEVSSARAFLIATRAGSSRRYSRVHCSSMDTPRSMNYSRAWGKFSS
jgi:hypothetical protein